MDVWETNTEWKIKLSELLNNYEYEVSPRGQKVREVVNGQYDVKMPAYITLTDRKVKYDFMFAEPWWVLSGSNRLNDIEPFMRGFSRFSDDGIMMNGAYGPKVVDQLSYVANCLEKDRDSRQAVLTIWRERPGQSKDIPCTVAMQFLIRDGLLHCVTTMRSNDIVLGFTYDVFTFSMISLAVKLMLKEKGINVSLGTLNVNAGSLHLYENHYKEAKKWILSTDTDNFIWTHVEEIVRTSNYDDLLKKLYEKAIQIKYSPGASI